MVVWLVGLSGAGKSTIGQALHEQWSRIDPEVFQMMGELGLWGLTVPEEYDGLGVSYTAYCRFMELVSRYCAATAATRCLWTR